MAKFVEEGADASAKKTKRDGPPKYTGRKGAVTRRTIGSEGPYKFISRAFRKELEKLTKRGGPDQVTMQALKSRYSSDHESWIKMLRELTPNGVC